MPKIIKALSALEVKRVSKTGLNAVGTVAGLCLRIAPENTKSWVYRIVYGGKRRLIGLGAYPAVTLSQAIEKARHNRINIDDGIDPIQIRRANKNKLLREQAKAKTFEQCTNLFLAHTVFGNVKHAKQWRATLEQYVYPHIGSMLVSDIEIAHIKEILDPIWHTKTETASRIQGRVKRIMDYAMVSGYREKTNPAQWTACLDSVYQSSGKLKVVKHFDSIPYPKIYEFLQTLQKENSMSARALEFLILTAVRSGSVRSATWSQIDLDAKVWTVPKLFTKTKKRDHAVPLTTHAIALLKNLPRFIETDLIFPSPRFKEMSDNTIGKLMRDMRAANKFSGIGVPHGFRASFATWRLERTNYSKELGDLCVMHEVGDAVYQAYQRSDGLQKRVTIMKNWSEFIHQKHIVHKSENIIELKRMKKI